MGLLSSALCLSPCPSVRSLIRVVVGLDTVLLIPRAGSDICVCVVWECQTEEIGWAERRAKRAREREGKEREKEREEEGDSGGREPAGMYTATAGSRAQPSSGFLSMTMTLTEKSGGGASRPS